MTRLPAGVSADVAEVADDVGWGSNLDIDVRRLHVGRGASIGSGVVVKGDALVLAAGARLENDVKVRCADVSLGHRAAIGARTETGGMGTPGGERLALGDMSLLASDCRVFLPRLIVGDYTKIHNHTLINGRAGCTIGHNCWIGQNNILNSEDELWIGNNVGAGIYSCIWTHAYFGDSLEGCSVFSTGKTCIEDDVWMVGAYNVIGPGVRLGRKSMVLTGSVVTRDVPENTCVAGNPAKVLSKIVPYRDRSVGEKLETLERFVDEFLAAAKDLTVVARTRRRVIVQKADRLFAIELGAAADGGGDPPLEHVIRVIEGALPDTAAGEAEAPARTTVISLASRTYTKTLADFEIRFLSFLISYRARFLPAGHQSVG